MIMTMLRKTILWATMGAFALMAPVSFADPSAGDETTMQEVKREMREAAEVIRKYSADQRDEAINKVKATLERVDARIERMEERLDKKANKMDQAARKQARSSLRALRKQRNELAEWYGGMQHSSGEAWQDIKTGFLKSYRSLQEAFNKAQQEF